MARVAMELAQVAERLETLRRCLEAEATLQASVKRLERENRRLRWRVRSWRWSAAVLAAGIVVVLLGKPELLGDLARLLLPALGR